MPSTAEQVKSIILKHDGGVSKQQIARELNLSLDYVTLICRDLKRKGKIAFSDGFYSLLASDIKRQQRRPSVLRNKPRATTSCRQGNPRKIPNETRNVYTESVLSAIPKMTKGLMEVLGRAGYKTIESLAEAPIARLMPETKLELHEAAGLINQARKALNQT